MRPSKPSQTLAPMDDEPTPTAVVRHSKQITKPLPPTASLFLQNGARTALQPVAVGANGEIGYIVAANAVPEPATVIPVVQPPPPPVNDAVDAASVYAESERMKHELEILQRKISDLNMAQQYQLIQNGSSSSTVHSTIQRPTSSTTPAASIGFSPLHLELASELQLIEKTIRDREMELQINTCMQKESPQGFDYGSYITHGTFIDYVKILVNVCTTFHF